MSGHTPGPWSVVDGFYPSFREIKGPSFTISIVMSATDLNFSDCLKREADANLIASAPDLLAERDRLKALNAELSTACQSLIDYCDKNKPMGDSLWSVQQIRAALAKAKHKGETT